MIITKAKVKYSAGAPREGQYGPSINILVIFADGKEARIYGKPGDPIQSLKQGDVIDVIDDNGKLTYHTAIGGQLSKYCGEDKAMELMDQVISNFRRFHPKPEEYEQLYGAVLTATTDAIMDENAIDM